MGSACVKCGYDPLAAVSAAWSFLIQRAVKSGNAHVYNVGASRWAYAKERDAWQSLIRARCNLGIPGAHGRRRVTLCRYYGGRQRELDGDNFQTGAKPVVDALVRERLLVDDRREFAEIHYLQIKTSVEEQRGLVITLEDLS